MMSGLSREHQFTLFSFLRCNIYPRLRCPDGCNSTVPIQILDPLEGKHSIFTVTLMNSCALDTLVVLSYVM